MKTNSNFNPNLNSLKEKIDAFKIKKKIPSKYARILQAFLNSYHEVLTSHNKSIKPYLFLFDRFLNFVVEQFKAPYIFKPFHRAIRKPIDYYQFGIDFLEPLVDLSHSTTNGLDYLEEMISRLKRNENVVLFANHQIEADPQAISILLKDQFADFAERLIFVAGMRVTTDPLAIPFSMGRNLLCIHSKKYIDTPPENKREKQLHNKRTMELMVELLNEGGQAIYVAPSGGRDRANPSGEIEVVPFDSQSIEMFYLMAKKAVVPTHFYTLALSTYHLLPPPQESEFEIGESRITKGGAIHLCFGPKVDMESVEGFYLEMNKREKRKLRAEFLWRQVKENYDKLPKN